MVSRVFVPICFLLLALGPVASASPEDSPSWPAAINVIAPSNQRFATLLAQHFPAAAGSAEQATLHRDSVLVVNDTKHKLRAVSLRWAAAGSDAKVQIRYSKIVLVPSAQIGKQGAPAALLPGQFLLATPSGFVVEHRPANALQAPEATLLASSAKSAAKSSDLTGSAPIVAVDSLIFGNGYAAGSDASGMVSDYVCERNGAIDEDRSILILDGTAEMQSRLTADASAQKQAAAGRSCAQARSQEAARLLALYDSQHADTFQDALKRSAFQEKLELRQKTPAAE